MVFGEVGIDLIAGPTELVIVADDSANPQFLAADLLSEAEHTGAESVVCITPSSRLVDAIQQAVSDQLANLPRHEEAARSLRGYSALIHTQDLQEAMTLVNAIGPEHLELMVEEAERWLEQVTCAGAIFLGHYSPAAIGDYYAGPNHVLPTGGTARFSSPVSYDDFVKKYCVNRYPDPEAEGLRHTLAKMLDVTPDMLLLGNGSDELVPMVLMACGAPGAAVLTPTPTFSMYGLGARMLDQRAVEVPLTADWGLDMPQMLAAIARERPRMTFLATPNNPTANCFDYAAVRRLIEAVPGVIVIGPAY